MSLAIALLAPVVVVLMFLGFQAALWNHAKAEARVLARETALLAARRGMGSDQAARAGVAAAPTTLQHVSVAVSRSGGEVVVVVTGVAPGILQGTSTDVSVRVAVPAEGWVPL